MESVYFGGVECSFQAVSGETVVFRAEDFGEADSSPEARAHALARKHPLPNTADAAHHPEEAQCELVIVAVPRTDPVVRPLGKSDPSLLTHLPALVQRPLVKCKEGHIRGRASGVRSGIVQDGPAFLRLKGCGNNDQGFTTRRMLNEHGGELVSASSSKPLCEIRGCAFLHTVHIEQLMSSRVDTLLASVGMQCGNKPLGWFEYSTPDLPFPRITRCCGIFHTLGDRRLSDHVLHGIEVLLPAFFDSPPDVLAHFPEGIFGPRAVDGTFQEMDETHMLFACGGSEMPHVFADLSGCSIPGFRAPAPVSQAGFSSDSSASQGSFSFFPRDAPQHLSAIWNDSCRALAEFCAASGDGAGRLLGHIYRRFGRECGLVSRTLAKAGICWGTFRDLSGTHCNAHGNNMVLVAQLSDTASGALGPFLAPVDFDFAYTSKEAVLSDTPERDPVEAEENIAFEMRALAMDLGLYRGSSGTKNDHIVEKSFEPLRWALRDTMVKAFVETFRDDAASLASSADVENQEILAAAHHLIRLALIKTWNVIA